MTCVAPMLQMGPEMCTSGALTNVCGSTHVGHSQNKLTAVYIIMTLWLNLHVGENEEVSLSDTNCQFIL